MIKYKSGYKYQLVEEYYTKVEIFPDEDVRTKYITFYQGGYLRIKVGYCWDGPSGPTVDTKNFMRGSLVHDVLYQLMREGLIGQEHREQADKELRRICLEDGMSKLRACWVYQGVRKCADFAADPKNKKKIITAP